MIHRVLLRESLPRCADLDIVAGQHAQVWGLLVLRGWAGTKRTLMLSESVLMGTLVTTPAIMRSASVAKRPQKLGSDTATA